jgi:outer membrane receptor protein involved in Fe transport
MQNTFSINCIRGVVSDTESKAVAFASVLVTNGEQTICDSAGNFELCFKDDSAAIIVNAYNADTTLISKELETIQELLLPKDIVLSEVAIVIEKNIKNTSMVSTISTNKEEMEMLSPQNISEVLQTKTGFTNRSGYQTPLTLRGLTGKRLLVLRNGIRRFSSYPAGYMSHTINVYDLERIDVEKGAASVVYGSGAIAGIVNLIDKSPFDKRAIYAKFTAGYGSVNNEENLLGGVGWSNGKLAFKTNLRYRTADDFKYADGSIAENSFYTDKDMYSAIGYKFSEKQELIFSTDIHKGGPWGKPVGFNGSNYMKVQTVDENSYNFSLQYKLKPGEVLQSTEINTFYSDEGRSLVKNYYTAAGYLLSYVETTKFSNYYYGTQIHNKIKVSNKYTIHTGGEFYGFHISTPTDAIDYIEGLSFQNRVSHNARSYLVGLYAENVFMPMEKFRIVAGIRYDWARVYEGDVYSSSQDQEMNEDKDAISGNIAASWRFKSSRLKLNVARSFRMPETTELYADSYTSNGILYANPDLEPEYCNSFDISYNYKHQYFEIELSPFVWLLDNMISREEVKGMPGTNYQYINLERSRIFGGEITVSAWINNFVAQNDKLTAFMGAAYLNGTDLETKASLWADGVPMDYIPPFNLKSNVVYHSATNKILEYNLAFRMIYYSEQKRLGESNFATPAYTVLECSAGLSLNKFKTKPSLNIAINNLLNTEYYSYLSYLPSAGRDIRVFLTININ